MEGMWKKAESHKEGKICGRGSISKSQVKLSLFGMCVHFPTENTDFVRRLGGSVS